MSYPQFGGFGLLPPPSRLAQKRRQFRSVTVMHELSEPRTGQLLRVDAENMHGRRTTEQNISDGADNTDDVRRAFEHGPISMLGLLPCEVAPELGALKGKGRLPDDRIHYTLGRSVNVCRRGYCPYTAELAMDSQREHNRLPFAVHNGEGIVRQFEIGVESASLSQAKCSFDRLAQR